MREPRAALAVGLRQAISPMRTERRGTSSWQPRRRLVWGW